VAEARLISKDPARRYPRILIIDGSARQEVQAPDSIHPHDVIEYYVMHAPRILNGYYENALRKDIIKVLSV